MSQIDYDEKLWESTKEKSKNALVVTYSSTGFIVIHNNGEKIGVLKPEIAKELCEGYIEYFDKRVKNE